MAVVTRLLAVALVLGATNARAGDAEPSERDRNVARESVYQGDDSAKKGDFKRALEAYRRANDIMKVPTTAIEVVRTSLKLGLLVEALAACEQTAAYPEKKGEPAPFTAARNEALQLITKLHERIPQVSLGVLTSDGVEPQVVVDGKALTDYAHVALNPGPHTVVASAAGLVSAQEEFSLTEGESRRLELVLKAPVATVVTTKGPATYWPLAFSGLGLTVAGLGAGAATGVLSLQAADELAAVCRKDASCPPNQGLESTIERRTTLGTISTVAFAAAGVGLVVGVPALVFSVRAKKDVPKDDAPKSDASPASVSFAPMFDLQGRLVPGASVTVW
jgi:hypothetical protein